jgi:hypothetical protein
MPEVAECLLEDAHIVFRNFSGAPGPYNREGDRNFAVILPPDLAEKMARDGWNIKQLNPRDEDEPGDFYIQVAVSFKGRPPRLVIVTSSGRTQITEATVDTLDLVDIKKADMILNPYKWEVNGKSGIKAYVKSLYIVLDETELDIKYADYGHH